MKKVKLAFYKPSKDFRGIDDIFIDWWTKSDITHTEIFTHQLEDGRYVSWTASGKAGGVVKRIRRLNPEKWMYKDVELKEEDINKIVGFFLSIENSKYDWLGLFGFVFPIRDREDRWFCSETTANSMKIVGDKRMWKLDPSVISPGKLAELYGVEKRRNENRFITFFTRLIPDLTKWLYKAIRRYF